MKRRSRNRTKCGPQWNEYDLSGKKLGVDYIFVSHKAGDRDPQKVIKFRAICPICKKDRGFRFVAFLDFPCSSCSAKRSYLGGKAVNPNHNGFKCRVKTKAQGVITFKSTYELGYYNYCQREGIEVLYEPEVFIFSDGTSFRPDFFLVKRKEYVETKGLLRPRDRESLERFKAEVGKIRVLDEKALLKLGALRPGVHPGYTIKIIDKTWSFRVLDDWDFTKRFGADVSGITITEKRRVFLRRRAFSKELIAHEMVHVFAAEVPFHTLCLVGEQYEEFFAEIYAKFGDQIQMKANTVFNKLKVFIDWLKDR